MKSSDKRGQAELARVTATSAYLCINVGSPPPEPDAKEGQQCNPK